MNTAKIWQRLLWKDGLTIKPLLIAVVAGIVLLNVITMVAFDAARPESATPALMIWVLLPNLMALGAPALSIGTEEENGTLEWLRTLPVRWQTLAASKLLVSVGSLLAAWALASLGLWLQASDWGPDVLRHNAFAADVMSLQGVMHQFFFSGVLLLCGFIVGYFFRSPVTALIVVAPLVTVTTYFFNFVGGVILGDRFGRLTYVEDASSLRWGAVYVAALGAWLGLWWIQRQVARRRLSAPALTMANRITEAEPLGAYRPPITASLSRPAPLAALLWQQWRQVSSLGLLLAGLAIVSLAFYVLDYHRSNLSDWGQGFAALTFLTVPAAFLWLGALTFYGDSVRRRCAFFADRGISPTKIWLTRLAPTLALAIVLLGVVVLADQSTERPTQERLLGRLLGLLAMYGIGQLVSQWAVRPTLSFFAAPVLATASLIGLSFFYNIYVDYLWTLGLLLPVLLFATWRLTTRWLGGAMGWSYHARATVYALLAVGLPVVVIFFHRWITLPPAMHQWQARMSAIDTTGSSTSSLIVFPDAIHHLHHQDTYFDWPEDIEQRVDQELAAEHTVGEFVSFEELRALLGVNSTTGMTTANNTLAMTATGGAPVSMSARHKALQVLLKWASLIRQGVVDGGQSFDLLLSTAEEAEAMVVAELTTLTARYGPTQKLKQLVDMIADEQLRRQSRRLGLIRQWQEYHETPWGTPQQNYFKQFAGNRLLQPEVAWLGIERLRSDRNVDHATKLLLEQIDSDRFFPQQGPEDHEFSSFARLWAEAQWGPQTNAWRGGLGPLVQRVSGMRTSDALLRALRQQYDSQR